MKVLLLSTSYPATKGHHQSPFIARLAGALSKLHEVDVVCPLYNICGKKEEDLGSLKVHRFQYFWPYTRQRLTAEGGIPSSLKASTLAKIQLPGYLVSYLATTLKHARKADVIHANWLPSALVGLIARKIYGNKLIVTTRGADMKLCRGLAGPVFKWVLKHCDAITSNNMDHVRELKKLGFEATACFNGIDTDTFVPRDKAEARAQLGIPPDELMVLFVGWLIERKGARYLIEAMKEYPGKLYILGDGQDRGELERMSGDNVSFVGSKSPEEVPLWMNAADIFVLPSLSEGRPNVVAEAMASGLPVIATAVNGTPELIDCGEVGVLIPPQDVKAIRTALDGLGDPTTRELMGARARASIADKGVSWDACARRFTEVYEGI